MMLMSSAGRPGEVCFFECLVDLLEDLRRIGAVVRLEHGSEPLLSEKYIRGIHGIGQTVGVNDHRLPGLDAIGSGRRAVNHANSQHSRVRWQHAATVGPDDDRRRVANPRVTDQPGLLIGDHVKPRAKVTLGKILLARHVQTGQKLSRLQHGD